MLACALQATMEQQAEDAADVCAAGHNGAAARGQVACQARLTSCMFAAAVKWRLRNKFMTAAVSGCTGAGASRRERSAHGSTAGLTGRIPAACHSGTL